MDRVSPDSIFSTSGLSSQQQHQQPSSNNTRNNINNQSSIRSRLYDSPVSPTPGASPPQQQPQQQLQPEKRFNLHNRRLQLRNAGFRGTPLPNRRISAQLSRWRTPSGEFIESEDKENSRVTTSPPPADAQSRGSRGRNSSKKVNILQEISYSTQRRRRQNSPRPSVAGLFQNCFDSPPVDQSSSPSISRGPASLEPALELENPVNADPFEIMRSREEIPISRDASPQLNNSLGRNSLRGQKKRRSGLRTSSADASRYIEHLETQLAASISQVEALKEPPMKPQIAKLKMLNEECKFLKQELEEWQAKFEARVSEEVESRAGNGSDSRKKLAALEREMEIKDGRINELEWEIESMTQKLRDFQSLDTTNRNLERRVDVLTGLLAQSPTRTDSGFSPRHECDTASPTRDKNRMKGRPRSMMPRIPPLSPEKDSMFQPLVAARTDPHEDPASAVVSPSRAPRNRDNRDTAGSEISTAGRTAADRSSMFTSASDTFSLSTDPTTISQRSSMISQSSSNWGLPLLFSPENPARHQNRDRKMRRFPSGSSSLKPLILPTAAVAMPMPPCYSGCQSIHSSPHDLSSGDNNYHYHTNTAYDTPPRRQPFPVVEEDSLDALEGRSNYYQSFEEAIAGHRPDMASNTGNFDETFYDSPPGNTDHDATAILDGDFSPDSQQLDVSRNVNTKYNLLSDELPHLSPSYSTYSLDSKTSLPRGWASHRKRLFDRDITPRPMKSLPETKDSSKYSVNRGAASACTLGIISNYSYFSQIWRNHTDLARRIILRAWRSNWKKLGRLSWWVLGLFVGPQIRDRWLRSTSQGKDFDWHRHSPKAASNSGPFNRRIPEVGQYTGTRLPSATYKKSPGEQGDGGGKSENSVASRFPLLGRSACLWARFSLALVIAIGLAFKDGPGTLLLDKPEESSGSSGNLRIESSTKALPTNERAQPRIEPEPDPCKDGSAALTLDEPEESSVSSQNLRIKSAKAIPASEQTQPQIEPEPDPCKGESSPEGQSAEQTLTWTRNLGVEDFMAV